MQPHHRLFGKELTNILDKNPQLYNKSRSGISQVCRHTRGNSCIESKMDEEKPLLLEKVHSLSIATKKEKINSTEIANTQLVPHYLDSCLNHMLSQQSKSYNLVNYMPEQKQISANMRGILIDWIVDLHLKFKMFPETLFSVVMTIDKYLMRNQISKDNLQLLGATAFFMVAKYEETYHVPQLKEMVHLSANAFTKKDVLKLEGEIVNDLGFNLIMDNTLKFMQPYVKLIQMSQKNTHLTQYILELALLDVKMLKYKPSLLAAAGIYLVNKIRRVEDIWPDVLVAASGLEEKDIKACAKQLCHMFENIDSMSNTKSLKKKFSLAKFSEVSKIRLQRREK